MDTHFIKPQHTNRDEQELKKSSYQLNTEPLMADTTQNIPHISTTYGISEFLVNNKYVIIIVVLVIIIIFLIYYVITQYPTPFHQLTHEHKSNFTPKEQVDDPKESPKETSKEDLKESSKEDLKETPKESSKEGSKDTLTKSINGSSTQETSIQLSQQEVKHTNDTTNKLEQTSDKQLPQLSKKEKLQEMMIRSKATKEKLEQNKLKRDTKTDTTLLNPELSLLNHETSLLKTDLIELKDENITPPSNE